jgi:uncharacterized protein (DUF427 family)
MKVPGPDHPIVISACADRVRVVFNGHVIAETAQAVSLQETSYRPVLYIPREDADMRVLERSDHRTHCPYKGDASYYSVRVGDRVAENAVWSYETPFPAMSAIAGLLAFYPDRVDAIEQAAPDL